MPNKPARMGKVQLQIMQALWKEGKATAREITELLSKTEPIAHSTVQTLLRKLEAKGAVTHELDERTFVFYPLYKQSEVSENAVHDLLTRVFHGSVYGLVSQLLKHENISPEELQRLRHLIDSAEKEEE
jgi:BlaI family transcriptional regulator, penicillinase repressor